MPRRIAREQNWKLEDESVWKTDMRPGLWDLWAEGTWAPDAHQTACPIAQALQDRVGGTACPGDDG